MVPQNHVALKNKSLRFVTYKPRRMSPTPLICISSLHHTYIFVVTVKNLEDARLPHHYEACSFHNCTCDMNKMHLCAPGNPHGDAFCCLNDVKRHEVHQCKHIACHISKDKAFKNTLWSWFIYFVYYIWRQLLIHLIKNCYGVYWTWVVSITKFVPLAKNDANYFQLTSVNDIGKTRVNVILWEETKIKFIDIEDSHKRTKIPIKYLVFFRYDSFSK